MRPRILAALWLLCGAAPAFAQSQGTLNLLGPSSTPPGPQITTVQQINGPVNAALAAKQDYLALTANQIIGALSAGATTPITLPSCAGASNALKWTLGIGFGCNTITAYSLSALATTSNLSDLSSPSTARTNLGLGTMATQSANGVAITGGSISNTPVAATTLSATGLSTFNGASLLTSPGTVGLIQQNVPTALGSNLTHDNSQDSTFTRWILWNNTLTPSVPTSNIWENDSVFLYLQPIGSGSGGAITATESGGTVTALTLTAGSGYPNGTYTLAFQGGGGSGAAGTLTVTGGQFASYSLTGGGSGYTSAPSMGVDIAVENGEINGRHTTFNVAYGAYSQQMEDHEIQIGNNGVSVNWNGTLVIPTNGATGIVTNQWLGSKYQLYNSNTTAGAIAEYAAIDNEPMGNGGSQPSSYFFIRQADPNASSNFAGPIDIGTMTPQGSTALFFVQSSGNSGTYYNFTAKNSSGNIFSIQDNGLLTTPTNNYIGKYGSANYISISGAASGGPPAIKAAGSDANVNLALQSTGAASVLTFNSLTIASATAVFNYPSASTGSGTQTFANSPCTGLTTEKWVPITITGNSGTFYIPACQ